MLLRAEQWGLPPWQLAPSHGGQAFWWLRQQALDHERAERQRKDAILARGGDPDPDF